MQNRFGVKDFFIIVLLIVTIVVVLLNMFQIDREKLKTDAFGKKLETIEQQVARVQQKLDKGVSMSQGSAQAAGGGTRDTSWARAGFNVVWQEAPSFHNDPENVSGAVDGGEFTEIWEAQTKVLTPLISTDVYSRRVQELVLESLGDLDPVSLKMKGLLADAWQIDPEGMWLRAHIRPQARFSDGQPVTAEDVRWTFHDYLMNEELDAERSRSIMRDCIEKVTVIDERTVEFAFKQRLFTNIDNALGMFVLPKHYYAKYSGAQINQSTGLLVGSGPFKLASGNEWAAPAPVIIERNPQYWGPSPRIAKIRFEAINEEIARLNSFDKGDADMITPSSPQFVTRSTSPTQKNEADYLKWINMRCGYSFIAWNCDKRNGKPTPFRDKRVRQAMTMLLDREKMINDIWKGIGVVAKGNMPLESPGANKDIKPWAYDRKKGLDLLAEMGWQDRNNDNVLEDANGNPFEFEYSYASGSEISERVARFVKDGYAAVGIRVNLRSADWSVYQDFLKKRDFDAITLGWGANSPESDPRQIFHSESIKNQGDNFTQWNHPEADRLIDEGRREMDPEKRAKIWQQFEAVLHEEQPYTFVRVAPWLRMSSKRIGNVQMYPIGLTPGEFVRMDATKTPQTAN